MEKMIRQPLKNRKHTPEAVLNLLWSLRKSDKFYFDTYGKMWLTVMIKEAIHKQTAKKQPNGSRNLGAARKK